MGYAWTRCRRCARRLTKSARKGIGPECATKEGLTGRAPTMAAIDAILELDDEPSLLRNEALREAARIEAGERVSKRTTRFLILMADRLKKTQENTTP